MNETTAQGTSRTWEVMCHLAALSMFIGVPFGNILGPLLVWLLKRSDSPSIDEHGKEALNFQISLSLYLLVLTVMTISLMFILIGFLLLPVLIAAMVIGPVIDVIFVVVAAIKASSGEFYRYPCTIRFIS
jgi:uncharacterized protein